MATEYERKRLENIRRNEEMLSALKVHAKATLLSASTKPKSKTFKRKKQSETETPLVIRQSQRTRGITPDSNGLPEGFCDNPNRMRLPDNEPLPTRSNSRVLGPLGFDLAYDGEGSYTKLVDSVLGIEKKLVKIEKESPLASTSTRRSSSRLASNVVKKEKNDSFGDDLKKEEKNVFDFDYVKSEEGFDLGSLRLEPSNVARLVSHRILVVKFLPSESVKIVVAGDKIGNVGFWNLDCDDDDEEEEDGVYLFKPHTSPVSSLVFQQNSYSKVISSSYDGLIRMMDFEKSVFDLLYTSDEAIFSLSQSQNDEQSLYFGEGNGMFKVWDLRAGKTVLEWDLHERRINTIDFNPRNSNIMATSSTDGTACLWDLRSMGAKKPKTLATVEHAKAVHSAYFSPSGLSLATTSHDNYVGILSGANYEDSSMIYHTNNTNRWISTFRGVWGWDDSYIFLGNLGKKIDVISPKLKKTVKELDDPLMNTIPCRISCHPLNVGMLAGASAGGQVYVWTTK